MYLLIPIALALVLVLAGYQVARLVLAASRAVRGRTHSAEDVRIVHLRDERERCLASLKELENDLEMGKLSAEDYDELRTWYEQRAVEVIRSLRELEKGARALLVAIALVGWGGSVRAQEMPPGHPPIDGMTPGGARAGDPFPANTDAVVRVIHTDATGARGPRAGVRIIAEAIEGQRDEAVALAVWSAVTGPDGAARLGRIQVPSGSTTRVMAVVGTTRFSLGSRTGGEWVIRTWDTTEDIDALSMDGRVDLAVEEGALTVRLSWTLINTSPVAIDLASRERPVHLPLVGPVAMGGVVSRGFMPPQATKHTRVGVSPDMGRVSTEGGGFAYRGLIPPGESVNVRIGYPLDYPADDMTVGVRAEEVPIRSLLFTLARSPRLFPELRLSVPAVGADADQGRDRVLMLKAIDPLETGAEVTLTLRHLPVHGRIGRWAATGFMVAGAVVLAIAFLRARVTRRGEPSA
ncbi:MAG: hypothetical protein AMXMBFR64_14240 [Myxococcales bacterium]